VIGAVFVLVGGVLLIAFSPHVTRAIRESSRRQARRAGGIAEKIVAAPEGSTTARVFYVGTWLGVVLIGLAWIAWALVTLF
jgi:hypothetical protein